MDKGMKGVLKVGEKVDAQVEVDVEMVKVGVAEAEAEVEGVAQPMPGDGYPIPNGSQCLMLRRRLSGWSVPTMQIRES